MRIRRALISIFVAALVAGIVPIAPAHAEEPEGTPAGCSASGEGEVRCIVGNAGAPVTHVRMTASSTHDGGEAWIDAALSEFDPQTFSTGDELGRCDDRGPAGAECQVDLDWQGTGSFECKATGAGTVKVTCTYWTAPAVSCDAYAVNGVGTTCDLPEATEPITMVAVYGQAFGTMGTPRIAISLHRVEPDGSTGDVVASCGDVADTEGPGLNAICASSVEWSGPGPLRCVVNGTLAAEGRCSAHMG